MSSSTPKTLILIILTLLAAGMYFAATQLSTVVEQENDPMSDFKTSLTALPAPASQESDSKIAPVETMLIGLKQRLEKEPDDVAGWVLLSKSYYHLQRWQQAEAVFEKAKALGYTGSWQPLPPIDSFAQGAGASSEFESGIRFHDYGNSKQ